MTEHSREYQNTAISALLWLPPTGYFHIKIPHLLGQNFVKTRLSEAPPAQTFPLYPVLVVRLVWSCENPPYLVLLPPLYPEQMSPAN